MPYLSAQEFQPPLGTSPEDLHPIDTYKRQLANVLDSAPFTRLDGDSINNLPFFDHFDEFPPVGATTRSDLGKTQAVDPATRTIRRSDRRLTGAESPTTYGFRDRDVRVILPALSKTPNLLQEQPPEPLKGPYTEVEIPPAPDTPEYDHPAMLNLAVAIQEHLLKNRTNRTILFLIVMFGTICTGVSLVSTFGPRAPEVQATVVPVLATQTPTSSEPLTMSMPTAVAPVLPAVSSLGNLQVAAPVPDQQTNAVSNGNHWDYYDPALDALIDVEQRQAGYVVGPGDTLWAISLLTYCEEFIPLAAQNGIEDPNRVEIGQTVIFDLDHQPTVESGETIYDVAARCSVDPLELAAANGLTLDQPLVAGTRLNVPR